MVGVAAVGAAAVEVAAVEAAAVEAASVEAAAVEAAAVDAATVEAATGTFMVMGAVAGATRIGTPLTPCGGRACFASNNHSNTCCDKNNRKLSDSSSTMPSQCLLKCIHAVSRGLPPRALQRCNVAAPPPPLALQRFSVATLPLPRAQPR